MGFVKNGMTWDVLHVVYRWFTMKTISQSSKVVEPCWTSLEIVLQMLSLVFWAVYCLAKCAFSSESNNTHPWLLGLSYMQPLSSHYIVSSPFSHRFRIGNQPQATFQQLLPPVAKTRFPCPQLQRRCVNASCPMASRSWRRSWLRSWKTLCWRRCILHPGGFPSGKLT